MSSKLITTDGRAMSDREKAFVAAYIESGHAEQACSIAGYSHYYCRSSAQKILSRCKPAIADMQQAAAARAEKKIEQAADTWQEKVDELIDYGTGRDEVGRMIDPHVAARALELKGKSEGRFSETIRHKGEQVTFNIDLSGEPSRIIDASQPSELLEASDSRLTDDEDAL